MRACLTRFGRVLLLVGMAICCAALAAAPVRAEDAHARVIVTNGGVPAEGMARVEYHQAGRHDGDVVAWAGAGDELVLPAGRYDALVTFEDGAAHMSVWLDGLAISGAFERTVEMNLPVASVTYHLTNLGEDAEGRARVELRRAGHHDGDVIAWANSGTAMRVPAGRYDVQAIFEDGAARRGFWQDGQDFAGNVEKSIEFGVKVAAVTYHLTNLGEDAAGLARVELRRAGHHDGDVIAWANSGATMRVPEGSYDVLAIFEDGAAHRSFWLDGQAFTGTVEKTLEVGTPVAAVTYHLTNLGEDAEGKARVELRRAGHHDGDVIAWANSGGTMRVPEGSYDVLAIFEDGAAHRSFWLDGQAFTGTVEKTLEVGTPVAAVTYHLANKGEDAEDRARVELRRAGKHDSDVIIWAGSGGAMRVPEGSYDVAAIYSSGMVNRLVWLDGQKFAGTVERDFDFGIDIAHPVVAATLNGADLGDQARIAFHRAGKEDEVGAMQSGAQAELEAGSYDIEATMPGAQGWLRKQALAGAQHLSIALQPLRTAELKPGAPAPRECTIEVYGVNFDFDKATLRPDSEPVLQAVLKLFTGTPGFGAEIGGHTDNIGTPAYNMKLSQARAEAVKAWLVQHGIAAGRVGARGYGDTHPLVANDTDDNRFRNRRVELRRSNCG